ADALALMARGQYTEAMEIFRELGDFRDCIEKIEECELAILEEKYTSALALVQGGRFVEAIEIFRELGNFRDSIAKIKECQTAIAEEQYTKAVAFMNAGKYEEAIEAFSVLDDYRDCLAKIEECRAAINQREYNKALAFIKEGSYDEAIEIFLALGNYLDSTAKIEECRIAKLETQYAEAISLTQAGRYDEAINILISLGDFRDSAARATECQYLSAHAMLNSGRYWDAYNRFLALGNYKDSVAQAAFALDIFQKQQYFDVTVGDYVTLGAFEQDNNEANGKEAIEWLVLRIDNGNTRRLLLISRYVLAAMPYHNTHEDVTWETCNLRSWLNETFYYEAFTDAERALIANSTVTASKNPAFGTNSGNATEDYVFLLRVEQLNVYLTKLSGAAALTESAAAQGAFADGNGQAWWWLLTPGRTQTYATLVLGNGSFYAAGDSVNAAKYGVRPVIWIEYELPGEAET
ncbi:MAG: hypothetical protein IJ012_02355, partial [Clostridia bacterium]|nr:hypothetical protein [Clostridia bacterium]